MCVGGYLCPSVSVQVMQFIEKKQQSHRSVSHLALSQSAAHFPSFRLFWPIITRVVGGSLNPLSFLCSTSDLCRYVLIDTPGQIEVFTWSASGTIITEALVRSSTLAPPSPPAPFHCPSSSLHGLVPQASSFPCVVVYVMDTPRSTNPVTFMSNMLYACRYVGPPPLPTR